MKFTKYTIKANRTYNDLRDQQIEAKYATTVVTGGGGGSYEWLVGNTGEQRCHPQPTVIARCRNAEPSALMQSSVPVLKPFMVNVSVVKISMANVPALKAPKSSI